MKFILVLLTLFSFHASALTRGDGGLRSTVGTPIVLDTSSTNVTSAAWVEFTTAASRLYACSAVQVHNTGAQPIKLGTGAVASERETGLLFPIGVSILIPMELSKGVRLAVRSMGATQSSGLLTFSCLQ